VISDVEMVKRMVCPLSMCTVLGVGLSKPVNSPPPIPACAVSSLETDRNARQAAASGLVGTELSNSFSICDGIECLTCASSMDITSITRYLTLI